MLRALLAGPGVEIEDFGQVPDDDAALAAMIQRTIARPIDLLVTTGGASRSEGDRLLPVLKLLGVAAERLQLAQRPGKPLVVGRLGAMPILGLPGNPIAAMAGALVLVRPLLDVIAGLPPGRPLGRAVRLADGVVRNTDRTEWLPARLEQAADGTATAHPLTPFGSARLRLLPAAGGLLEFPPGDEPPRWHAPWSAP